MLEAQQMNQQRRSFYLISQFSGVYPYLPAVPRKPILGVLPEAQPM